MSQLQESLKQTQGDLSKSNDDNVKLKTIVNMLKESLEKETKELSTLKEVKLPELRTTVATNAGQAEGRYAELVKVDKALEDKIKAEQEARQSKDASAGEQQGALDTAIKALQGDVTTLKSGQKSNADAVAAVQASLDALKAHVATLKK